MGCINKHNRVVPEGIKREKFELPELGKDNYVWLRSLSAKELIALREQFGSKESTDNISFVLEVLSLSMTDDDGGPVYASAEELLQYLDVSLSTIEAMAEATLKASGLAKRDPEKN
jgi:hypothetical protein